MAPEKAVYLLVVDGFADWEPAHAVAELRRHGQYRVESVGLTSATVESMGGIRVQPSTIVTKVEPGDVATFILPGGDRWENSLVEPELERLLNDLDSRGTPIAAICAATVAIARLGLLRGRRTRATVSSIFVRTFPGIPKRRTTWTVLPYGIAGSSPPVAWPMSSLRVNCSKN